VRLRRLWNIVKQFHLAASARDLQGYLLSIPCGADAVVGVTLVTLLHVREQVSKRTLARLAKLDDIVECPLSQAPERISILWVQRLVH
jgi:hypothetical protein